MPRIASWSVRTPAGDAAATLTALADGRARPGRLPGDLGDLLAGLGEAALDGRPPDLVLVATTKGDLPRWVAAVLEQPLRLDGGPADLAQRLGRHFACPAMAVGAACASGPAALAEAARAIRHGDARRVLVLGGDRLAPFVEEGFAALGAVDAAGCRPFDRQRAGLALGETAAALVLEAVGPGDADGGIFLHGWGQSLDAGHLTAPARDGEGLGRACAAALARGGMARPGLIIAHGTGTRANDDAEACAYAHLLPGVPVCGWKGGLGHSLGASGLTEAALVAEALRRGTMVPGTWGLGESAVAGSAALLGPGAHPAPPGPWLSANAGFGGMNGAVLIGHRPPEQEQSPTRTAPVRRSAITADDLGLPDGPDGRLPRPTARQVLDAIDPSWGRMDGACRLLVALGRRLGPWPEGAGIILLSDHGSAETDARFERSRRAGAIEHQAFAYTLASAPVGEASIRLGIRGPGYALAGIGDEDGRRSADRLIADGCPAVLLAQIETGGARELAWAERWEG